MIRLATLKPTDLDVFRNLLGSTDFGGCFCAVWTSYGDDWESRCEDKAQPNYFATAAHVKEGKHVGYLVYENDKLVGWTGAGPKTSFPLLKTKLGSRLSAFTEKTWVIGCIALKTEHRGRNLSDRIVEAVIAEAISHGAEGLESFPVRPFHEPRVYRGTEGLYKRAGFKEIGADKDGDFDILLMQRKLAGST